jgi:hypothetical protein
MLLLRHLYEVVVLERPLDLPWKSFFGGGREYGPLSTERPRA